MEKLANAIANVVKAGQDHDWTKLGTSIVDIVENGVNLLTKVFGG
ncbi:beta-class phenol-soluble modulin [Staphylococcus caprae]|nr:beta-class phenol-soluble modulin [Staphylococcus caprae]MCI2955653.1 beta-class phenol-soluble modulin [Staphylococcus caprae]